MTNQELIEIKVLFDQAAKAFDTMSKKTEGFEKAVDDANKKFAEAETKTKNNANAIQNAGGVLSNFGKGLDSLGNKLLYFGASWSAGVSVPLQRFGQESVELFLETDKEWTRMSKAVGESIDGLKTKYGELAEVLSARFGQSQALVIESFTEIAKAGFDSEEQIKSIGLAASKAAVNFDTDLVTATQLTIQMMSQWGWTLEDVEVGLSMVNEVADATATSELGLAQAFTIAGPAAKALGIESEILAAQIAAVQRKGFTATKTGYALNTLYQRISTQAGDLSDALEVMGVKMSATEIKSKTGAEKVSILAKAYKDFRDKTKLSSDAIQDFAKQAESADGNIKTNNKSMSDMADAISILAGKQHFPKLLALLDDMANGMDNNVDTISDYRAALEAAGIGNEELAKIFDAKTNKALESASAKWATLREKINNNKIQIGELITVALVPLVDKFNTLLDKFDALDDKQKENIVKWGMIATAIGPVSIVLASLTKALALVTGPTGLGGLLSAVGSIVGAIGAGPFLLIAGAIASVIYWFSRFAEVVKTNFLDKLNWEVLNGIITSWNLFVAGIKEGFSSINESGAEASFMDVIANGLENIAQKLNTIDWAKVRKFALDLGEVIGVALKIVVVIGKVIGAFMLMQVWLGSLSGVISDWTVKTIEEMVKFGEDLFNKVTTFLKPIIDLWKASWELAIALARAIFYSFVFYLKSQFDLIVSAFKIAWGIITALFPNLKRDFDAFVTGIGVVLKLIAPLVKTSFENAMNIIKGIVKTATTWGADMITNFINGITSKVKALTDKVNWVADEIKRRLGFSVPEIGPLSKADTWMPDMITLLTSTLNKATPQIVGMVNSVAQQIQSVMSPNALLAGLGAVSPTLQFTPTANTAGFADNIAAQLATPINAALPQQNVVQVHKHYEFKPGVAVASPSEAREFVRYIQQVEKIEDIRTGSNNVTVS